MRRNLNAGFLDRASCFVMRAVVLVVLAGVLLGLWLAAQGREGALGRSALLFVIGSVIPYLAQVFADASGVYSRAGLLNNIVKYYSWVCLPALGFFILSRLWLAEFGEAGGGLLVLGFFWFLGFSTRARRRQREGLAHAVV